MIAFKLLNLILSISIKNNVFVSVAITALNQRLMSPPTLMLSLLFKKKTHFRIQGFTNYKNP